MAQQDVRGNRDDDLMRYRRAVQDGLQQLDWWIGHLHGIQKGEISKVLAKNRSYIRTQLLKGAEPPARRDSKAERMNLSTGKGALRYEETTETQRRTEERTWR